jgi:dTDP-glucose 4,6-dehydratase
MTGILPSGRTILVTGGAGFIGSALCRLLVRETDNRVINLDKLSYASDLRSLASIASDPRYRFVQADICDKEALGQVFSTFGPDSVMHLAAESHVDRSIDGPSPFIHSNIVGTYSLLEAARSYFSGLDAAQKNRFRFLHVSTDEVYGSLGQEGYFTEHTPYDPRSPYSASKAASDHLVMAWHHTFGMPALMTNCGNNYGPYQFPEKFIPTMIIRALRGQKMPVYGSGTNVRDWIHVDDHARALAVTLANGSIGQKYNIGASQQKANLEVAQSICALVDRLASPNRDSGRLIEFVADRPGHDQRYAIDPSRARQELGWRPRHDFADGLESTVRWYIENKDWWSDILDSGRYGGERQGLSAHSSRAPDTAPNEIGVQP